MWAEMFIQFDTGNDGFITWEECWGFLKANQARSSDSRRGTVQEQLAEH